MRFAISLPPKRRTCLAAKRTALYQMVVFPGGGSPVSGAGGSARHSLNLNDFAMVHAMNITVRIVLSCLSSSHLYFILIQTINPFNFNKSENLTLKMTKLSVLITLS